MRSQFKLFPLPLPDEHILSTLVRWHAIQYHKNFYSNCKDISNNLNKLNPDSTWRKIFTDIFNILPASFTKNELFKHTHFNYYATFQPEGIFNSVLSDEHHSKMKIIPKFQNLIRNSKLWRWCHICSHEDESNFGTSYWHSSHQIPSSSHCKKHKVRLIGECSNCKYSINDLASGILPAGTHCMRCRSSLIKDEKDECSLENWICDVSIRLLHSDGTSRVSKIKSELQENFDNFLVLHNINTEKRNHASMIQNAFSETITLKNLAETYFSREFSVSNSRIQFNVNSVIFGKESYPPLYYLLLLKALINDDHKIYKILGIKWEIPS